MKDTAGPPDSENASTATAAGPPDSENASTATAAGPPDSEPEWSPDGQPSSWDEDAVLQYLKDLPPLSVRVRICKEQGKPYAPEELWRPLTNLLVPIIARAALGPSTLTMSKLHNAHPKMAEEIGTNKFVRWVVNCVGDRAGWGSDICVRSLRQDDLDDMITAIEVGVRDAIVLGKPLKQPVNLVEFKKLWTFFAEAMMEMKAGLGTEENWPDVSVLRGNLRAPQRHYNGREWYVAARRMAYVRIRHEVSKTYAVLDESHEDRALLHFVFGRNRTAVDAAEQAETPDDGSEKPKAMLELPDVVFRLVCRMLE